MSLTERIIKGSSVVLFFTLLVSPTAYLIRILYSHNLSIEMYGLFYSITSLFVLLAAYIDLGLGSSVTYFLPKYIVNKDYSSSWKIYFYSLINGLGAAVIISLILIIAAPYLATSYFKTPEATIPIYIFCIYLISGGILNAIGSFFIGLQKEKYYSSMGFIKFFLILIFSGIIYLSNQSNIIFYSIAWAIAYLTTVFIYFYFLKKEANFIFNIKEDQSSSLKKISFLSYDIHIDRILLKKMYAYALPTLIAGSISSITSFTDTFYLTLFKGLKDVGIYNIVIPIASIPLVCLMPINNFLLPLVSNLMEADREKLNQLINYTIKLIPLLGLYFSLFMIMFPSAPVMLLFGNKWLGLAESPLVFYALGYIPTLLSIYMITIIQGIGHVRARLKVAVIVAILGVMLSGFLIYHFGILGGAYSSIIVNLTLVVLLGRVIKKVIPFTYPYLFYIKAITFAFVLYTFVKVTNISPFNWPTFILAGGVYTIIFTIFAYFAVPIKLNLAESLILFKQSPLKIFRDRLN